MTAPDPRFLAQLLEPSASAYASDAAARLCEHHPGPATHGHGAWKGLLEGAVRELAAALRDALPASFEAHARWCREAYSARDLEGSDLALAFDELERALADSLPGKPAEALAPYFEAAREGLAAGTDPGVSPVARSSRTDLARTYVERALIGDVRGACALLTEAVDDGVDARDLVLDVLKPAQQEVGQRWHLGEVLVAEEHLLTQTTRRALATLLHHAHPSESLGRTVLLATVAGDEHDLGIQLLAALFELEGWRAVSLGADVPTTDLAPMAERVGAQVVCLAATLGRQRGELERAVRAVRDGCEAKVLLGGSALRDSGELWRDLGAHGYAPSFEVALAEAARLAT